MADPLPNVTHQMETRANPMAQDQNETTLRRITNTLASLKELANDVEDVKWYVDVTVKGSQQPIIKTEDNEQSGIVAPSVRNTTSNPIGHERSNNKPFENVYDGRDWPLTKDTQ